MTKEYEMTDKQIQERKEGLKQQGYWICPKCNTKYYAGIVCDICVSKEFKQDIQKLAKRS